MLKERKRFFIIIKALDTKKIRIKLQCELYQKKKYKKDFDKIAIMLPKKKKQQKLIKIV